MEYLPKCEILMTQEEMTEWISNEECCGIKIWPLEKIKELISGMIQADCWGVSINDLVIPYNSYKDKNKGLTLDYHCDYFNNKIRDLFNDSYESVLSGFYQSPNMSFIDIYMFGKNSWKINIIYDPSSHKFEVKGYFENTFWREMKG
jgi:hypothetical protein